MIRKLKCVLLIDDDEDDNYFHSLVLKATGVIDQIYIAENGMDALTLLQEEDFNPELIFLDINMPGINGWELLEELEKIKKSIDSVIVILTTSMSPSDKKRAENTKGISHFETKPLNRAKIRSILFSLFDITVD